MAGLSAAECNTSVDASIGRGRYIKLHTGDPGAAGTSNAASHTTRVQATYGSSSGGTATSTTDTSWTSMSAAETISHFSRWTASTGGTFLGNGPLSASKTVAIGDTLTIPSGSLTCTITPAS